MRETQAADPLAWPQCQASRSMHTKDRSTCSHRHPPRSACPDPQTLDPKAPTALCSPGVSEADLDDAESKLAVKLPMAYRLLLRLHNGQSLQSAGTCSSLEAELFRGELPEAASGPPSAGLFGGWGSFCCLFSMLLFFWLHTLTWLQWYLYRSSNGAGPSVPGCLEGACTL